MWPSYVQYSLMYRAGSKRNSSDEYWSSPQAQSPCPYSRRQAFLSCVFCRSDGLVAMIVRELWTDVSLQWCCLYSRVEDR